VEILINMTIAGTVTAVIILILKALLKDKLTPKWHCLLWIILAVRLLIPSLPESDFSLLNTIPTAQNFTSVERSENSGSVGQTASLESGKTAGQKYLEGSLMLKAPVTGMEQTTPFSITEKKADLAVLVWMTGMILMAVFLTGSYIMFYRKARKFEICKDPETLAVLDQCKKEVSVASDKIILRIGSNTPMLQGLIRPAILIPDGYSGRELYHIFVHELCHYKHRDVIINIICCIFLCIYWFNPVFWLCFFVIRRDLEMLCDERVIDITDERKEYATVLLKTALRKNQFLFATTSIQNGEKEVSRRIRHIAYFKKPKLWVSTLAVAIILVIGTSCLTNANVKDTLNLEVGGGYFFQIPKEWIKDSAKDLLFYNKAGENFGGISIMKIDLGEDKNASLETIYLSTPNHSHILERKVVNEQPFSYVIINLDQDTENQNHIFIWPDKNVDEVYTIWADSSEVNDRQLIKIAKTFQENPYPQGYQPEIQFHKDWKTTADRLLKTYFQNYVDAEMSMSSDISGYHIGSMSRIEDENSAWSLIYPDTAVFKVDYTLDIAYPDYYSFPGGGFEIGEGNRTKIYHDELAVFQKDWKNDVKFLGFVWPQNRGELGDSRAILYTINHRTMENRAKALLEYQTPYIGNSSKVSGIIANMPLAQYSTGMELHTKAEPYGLTVNYDVTKAKGKVFEDREGKALTDSSGWGPTAELQAQLFQNSTILFSLIDNCYYVNLKVTGISEFGAPYTHIYVMDREIFNKTLKTDSKESTKNVKKYSEFLSLAEQSAMEQYYREQ